MNRLVYRLPFAQLVLALVRAAAGMLLVAVGAVPALLGGGRRDRRPRIAFQAAAVHFAWFYERLIAELRRDGRVEVVLVTWPQPLFPWREQRRVRDLALSCFGLSPAQVLPHWRAAWQRFDAVVYPDVRAAFSLRRARRILLFHGAGLRLRSLERHWPGHSVYDFDVVFPSGPFDRDLIEQYRMGRPRPTRVEAAGCPQIDKYFGAEAPRAGYLARLGLTDDRPVVVYAPHWSGLAHRGDEIPAGVAAAIRVLAALPAQVVIKLHAFSFMPAGALGRRWEPLLRDLESPHVRVDWSEEDVDALLAADVLVTDISSRAFNFMLLDKPVVLLPGRSGPEDEVARRRLGLMLEASVLARSLPELAAHVRDALAHPDRLGPARCRVAERIFANPGAATTAVAGILYEEIGLGPCGRRTGV